MMQPVDDSQLFVISSSNIPSVITLQIMAIILVLNDLPVSGNKSVSDAEISTCYQETVS